MLVSQYRKYERQAQSLFGKSTPYHVELLALSERLKIPPLRVERTSMRSPELVAERIQLLDEMVPVKVAVAGFGPWKVRLCACCPGPCPSPCPQAGDDGHECVTTCSAYICLESGHCRCDAGELCSVREMVFRDLERMNEANHVDILIGDDTGDWEWSVYQTVREVVSRSRTSPFSPWTGRPQSSDLETLVHS